MGQKVRRTQGTGRARKKPSKEENSAKNTGGKRPVRDSQGRLRGGNPGNTGGKKGRSGRPPKAFKVFCRDVLTDSKVQARVITILRKQSGGGYASLLKLIADHGVGVPAESVDVRFDLSRLSDKELEALERIRRKASPATGSD